MSVLTETLRPPAWQRRRIPPLQNGDRLSAREFLRRYEAMPDERKAELVEGVVYMSSPVRIYQHAAPDTLAQLWLASYAAQTRGTLAAGNGTVLLDTDNTPQPDSFLCIIEACGGRTRVNEDDYLVGAPELVVEIAASSASLDLHDKLRAYRRNGAQEYLVWLTEAAELRWHRLQDGEFVRLQPDARGVFRSEIFPGLWLDAEAALRLDSARVLAVLRRGLAGAPHRKFTAQLAARRAAADKAR